jgi:hypothetical protein
MTNKNRHWIYLAGVFILTYLWQLAIYFTGGIDSMLFPLMLLFPAIAAIVFRIINREGFRNIGWGVRRWWYVIPAGLVPLAVIVSVGGFLSALNWASLSDKHFVFREGMVGIKKIPLILGHQTQSLGYWGLNLALSLFTQSLIGSLLTIGEEFGWRG